MRTRASPLDSPLGRSPTPQYKAVTLAVHDPNEADSVEDEVVKRTPSPDAIVDIAKPTSQKPVILTKPKTQESRDQGDLAIYEGRSRQGSKHRRTVSHESVKWQVQTPPQKTSVNNASREGEAPSLVADLAVYKIQSESDCPENAEVIRQDGEDNGRTISDSLPQYARFRPGTAALQHDVEELRLTNHMRLKERLNACSSPNQKRLTSPKSLQEEVPSGKKKKAEVQLELLGQRLDEACLRLQEKLKIYRDAIDNVEEYVAADKEIVGREREVEIALQTVSGLKERLIAASSHVKGGSPAFIFAFDSLATATKAVDIVCKIFFSQARRRARELHELRERYASLSLEHAEREHERELTLQKLNRLQQQTRAKQPNLADHEEHSHHPGRGVPRSLSNIVSRFHRM